MSPASEHSVVVSLRFRPRLGPDAARHVPLSAKRSAVQLQPRVPTETPPRDKDQVCGWSGHHTLQNGMFKDFTSSASPNDLNSNSLAV